MYHDKVHAKSIISETETTLTILANFPENENWGDKSNINNLTPG